MQIKVIKETKAASSPEGIACKIYEAGKVYDIYDSLAEVFIAQGWGKKAEQEKKEIQEKAIEEKVIENKAIEKAPENKEIKKDAKKKSASKKKISK